jgi:hypothetical protein
MKFQEAAEGVRVCDMHVSVTLGVAQKSVFVGILAGKVDEDKPMAGALLGQELVHEVHVGPSLLVAAKVGVLRILYLTSLTNRRWDIINA